MQVTTEELNWDIPLLFSDGFENGLIFGRVEGSMTSDEEEVNVTVADGFLKPGLLDSLFDFHDLDIVCGVGEIKDEAKSKDPDSLILGCEFLIALRQRLHLVRLKVPKIKVRCYVIVFEVRHGGVVLVVDRGSFVEFMIARTDDINVLVREDGEIIFALRM